MTDARSLSRDTLRHDVSEMLDGSEVAGGDNLLDLGLDSMRIMTLVQRLGAAGVEVGFIELVENPTLDAWWSLVSARGAGDGEPA